jgi:hypothetical protein
VLAAYVRFGIEGEDWRSSGGPFSFLGCGLPVHFDLTPMRGSEIARFRTISQMKGRPLGRFISATVKKSRRNSNQRQGRRWNFNAVCTQSNQCRFFRFSVKVRVAGDEYVPVVVDMAPER